MFIRSKDKAPQLRSMTRDDMEEVREVGQIAWSDLATHDIGRKFKYPKRSERIIDAYLSNEPGGCIVAEEDGKIIGSAFAHVWGRIGWIGPLEVLPACQSHGVGKLLLGASEQHLRERGCEIIGLETMSHIPKHIHFYMSSGYRPSSLILIVEKVLRYEGRSTASVVEPGGAGIEGAMPAISRLSAKVNPLLDYSREAAVTVGKRLGNVYIFEEGGEARGAAIMHSYQRGEEASYSSIKALLVDPQAPNPLEIMSSLLSKCEQVSLEQGKNRLLTRFSGDHLQLYNVLLSHDYMLKGANVRMTKLGDYRENGSYHITSWAG